MIKFARIRSGSCCWGDQFYGGSDAICALKPSHVLDVGCGEGWLTRTLKKDAACDAVGIDGSAELIEAARAQDTGGHYVHLAYETLAADPGVLSWSGQMAICNFSILSEDIVPLLAAVRQKLEPNGHLLVQTLHSWSARGPEGYQDGWRKDDFKALPGDDWAPMSWYFRTLESWVRDLGEAGFNLQEIREPRVPGSDEPVSLMFVCANGPA